MHKSMHMGWSRECVVHGLIKHSCMCLADRGRLAADKPENMAKCQLKSHKCGHVRFCYLGQSFIMRGGPVVNKSA